MTVLVTGASGFIGSHVTERLLKDGYEVRVLLRSNKELGIEHESNAGKVIGNLLDEVSLENALQGVETVYHLAGELRMGLVSRQELTKVNVLGAQNLIRLCGYRERLPFHAQWIPY